MALSEAPATAATTRLARDALTLVTLTSTDIAAGLALSDAAGWNQTADDWAIFIERGAAIGYRDAANRVVATAAALPYGARTGWISMVLVADAWRHRGLASELLNACVEHLRARDIVPVLDATPAGAAVYARSGFEAGFEIDRWEWNATTPTGALNDRPAPALMLGRASIADLDAVAALDRAATSLDRRFLLHSFLSRPGTSAWLTATGHGFVVARAGRRAMQIGPLAAENVDEAIALLATAFASASEAADRVFLDLPRGRRELATWLEAQGFKRQRPFVRMSLAATHPPTLGDTSFVLAGPEFG